MFFDNFMALCDSKNIAPTKAVIDAGLPKSSWSYWKKKYEQGEDPKPSSENVSKLASFFGCSVDFLLTGKQKETTPALQSQIDADMEWIKQQLMAMPADKRTAVIQLIKNSVK